VTRAGRTAGEGGAAERRAPRWITLDLGNSRCKVRAWDPATGIGPRGEPARAADFDGAPRLAQRLADWLRGEERPALAFLSSVAAPAVEERVAGVLAAAAERVLVAPPPGLEVLCRVPAEVGRDRLYAARGALSLLGRSAVVVDAGTALTVDAVLHREKGPGAFLGGAIAPGPRLSAEALASGAARLPRVEPEPGVGALGRDTREAIRAGVGVGFRGAARELLDGVSHEADLEDAPVVLTGGARAFLLLPRPFTSREIVRLPDVVHLGLLAAGLDAAGLPRSARAVAGPP